MDIDFVLLWVDGDDPVWLHEKNLYMANIKPQDTDDANGDCRYRSGDVFLRFWFRGIEQNASWVHKVYFISSGQIPSWMNLCHPALEIVDHKDFIPKEYLPTFNCRPIHFNLHRIRGLSERFVLFDDDTYLLNKVSPEDFFRQGMPVLNTYLGYLNKGNEHWNRILWNDYGIVNTHFNIGKAIWENRRKWFNVQYLGFRYAAFNFFCYCVNKTLPVYTYGHLPSPQLKSTISKIWDVIPEEVQRTCQNKFRSDDQLNSYFFSAWNQACGNFFPVSIDYSLGKFFSVTPKTLQDICLSIERESLPIICINDSSNNTEYDNTTTAIIESFVKRFPDKSSFEK